MASSTLTPSVTSGSPPPFAATTEVISHTNVKPKATKALRYDPEVVAQRYRGRYWLLARRLWAVITPFLFLLLRVSVDKALGVEPQRRVVYAARLREILTKLGPAYIKIGQALSTRPDLVSPVFLEELTTLQDQLPPFADAIAMALIREELGAEPMDIYAELTPHPIAAASLGQVYRGRLKTGEEVAVKVQRPDLIDRISIDMYVVRVLAIWLERFVARIKSDLVGIVDEFASKLYEEMDYTQEGRNADHFRELYTHPSIYIPKIYWEYTNRRVLTMEWIEGIKLTQLEKIEAMGLNGRELVEIGVNCSLRQLLENGFFHADPHPGNLLATADGRLAYLDFGMMSTVEPHQRYGLINAVVHLVNRDFAGLANDYVELGFLTPDTDLSPIIPALGQVFAGALGASVGEMNFKSLTDQLSEVMYEFPFRVPAYYALIIRSLVTLEGVAIGIDEDFKVLSVAYPYVANRLLSDPAPELRRSLQEVLFKDGEFRWNRLENLLRNASSSEDYDLESALDKASDFLFSERGAFIRNRLVDVLLSEQQGGTGQDANTGTGVENMQRIWSLLAQDPNFEPWRLLPVVGKLVFRPEAQQLGQQLVSRWFQRSAARWLRSVLVPEETQALKNGRSQNGRGQMALPPSRV